LTYEKKGAEKQFTKGLKKSGGKCVWEGNGQKARECYEQEKSDRREYKEVHSNNHGGGLTGTGEEARRGDKSTPSEICKYPKRGRVVIVAPVRRIPCENSGPVTSRNSRKKNVVTAEQARVT